MVVPLYGAFILKLDDIPKPYFKEYPIYKNFLVKLIKYRVSDLKDLKSRDARGGNASLSHQSNYLICLRSFSGEKMSIRCVGQNVYKSDCKMEVMIFSVTSKLCRPRSLYWNISKTGLISEILLSSWWRRIELLQHQIVNPPVTTLVPISFAKIETRERMRKS